MAKMFYTLDEAAQRLGVTPDEVRGMVASGQLKEFRDRDQLIFKKEQVDLLSKGDEIPITEGEGSSIGLSLEDSGPGSGSGPGMNIDEGAKEKSGISIFDTEDLEAADPSAVTQVSATGAQELTMESVGSGSGLLDLTREGDDTSLGADLLEDVYAGEEGLAESETQGASGLFETTPMASDASAGFAGAPTVLVAPEPYDGLWSGIAGGAALGAIVVAAVALVATLLGIVGVTENPVVGMLPGAPLVWLAIFAGVVIVLALIGALVGAKS